MENATRLSSGVQAVTDHIDATRAAPTPVVSGETTRIARDARSVDLQTEGTRIRGVLAAQRNQAAEHEIDERYRVGDKIGGRYEVLAIHRGAMGVVYGAYDHIEKMPRALKTLQKRHSGNLRMENLFTAEATTWVKLEKHPFIVRAYLVQKFDGQPYVITEYVRGQKNMGGDLRAWLGHPRLTLHIAVEMALQIAQGMQHAVRKVPGLVHRDLKPANILVDERARAMVTDFGLVEEEDTGAGTPAYMAPEQWRSEPIDTRTDIYAYGCILYELFTGHRMFAANNEAEWRTFHEMHLPANPIAINQNLPLEIAEFIFCCIAKQGTRRPSNWDEVVLECARWFHEITGQPVVFDYSSDALSTQELLSASYSLGELGKYQDMLEVCDRILTIDPNVSAAWYNKGNAYLDLDRLKDAIPAFDRALAIDPNNASTLFNKGNTLCRLDRNEEALAAYNRALDIDPSQAFAWDNKGNILSRLGRNADAISAYDRALSIDPNFPNAWYNKGNSLLDLGRLDEAIFCYDHTLAISPVYPGAIENRSLAQARERNSSSSMFSRLWGALFGN